MILLTILNSMAFFGRGKNKITGLHSLADSYKHYTTSTKGNSLYSIEYKIYVAIIRSYYATMLKEIINSGYQLKLPYRFGSIRVIKRKVDINNLNRFGIDWVETVKNDKIIYHLNHHSKGYIYKFKWVKENTMIPNLYFYKFVPSRSNKRELAKTIKNKQCDYFE